MSDDFFTRIIDCMWKTCKWFVLQVFLYFLTPYLWNYEYGVETLSLILLYTLFYVAYFEFIPKERLFNCLLFPYILYSTTALLLYNFADNWNAPIWTCLFLPLHGLICFICFKLLKRYSKRTIKTRFRSIVICSLFLTFLFILKSFSVLWMCREHDSIEQERNDIIERRDYLLDKLITSPQNVLDEMPAGIGTQFQGEWALYSCSMLSAALVNISHLYPETREENILYTDSLINIVMSPEIRYYDTMRWDEDPLETLDGNSSHVSYISHLAWMICGYKDIGGDNKYDELLSSLCKTMNRRILKSKGLNLPTYPDESIYVPDMLVAIVALNQYADMHKSKYRSTVKKWIKRAQKDWIDNGTGLLVSFLDENGNLYKDVPIKGSYSALNCYYLTFIDETFAYQQYKKLKSLFWKDGFISGLKEYWDRSCPIGIDIDAGPILFELSPSGTAFFAGSSAFFNDAEIRNEILTTAEIAGHTIKIGNKRHYLLANVALVGEAIMLAMRTNFK